MPSDSTTPSRDPAPGSKPVGPGPGGLLAGIGAAVAVIVCCAGPALLAAGVLGAVGAFLANPWVIVAAAVVVGTAVVTTVRRRSRRRACRIKPPTET
ncbi:MAG: hypothetical protein HOW97_03465 [Catenulispora sp.]|nr:hypothetical protein [Catenulispora sp.]NUR60263.1 hypothetical protein [Catenulispora sp.]